MPFDATSTPCSALRQEWFTAAELAALALPGLQTSARGVQLHAEAKGWSAAEREGSCWRKRQGRGGGLEYHYGVLPAVAQARLTFVMVEKTPEALPPVSAADIWAWFERQPDTKKRKARDRLEALDQVDALVLGGVERTAAMRHVAHLRGVSLATLYSWVGLVAGAPRQDRLPWLAPRHAGSTAEAPCSPEAWDWIKADWLRLSQPTFLSCWRRLEAKAAEIGWTLPAARTLERRLAELPVGLRTLMREGSDAVKRLVPAQQRDKTVFHALEAVNADGHQWDVRVQWPGIKEPLRPVMVCFQDLYSGMILAWRIDTVLSWHAVRVAFGDVVEQYGIPSYCWLDNGREFANKRITGGQANRYRFKVKAEDPEGLLTALGVKVHWTRPYSGQSKPIERAFRDMAGDIAKHPAFEGAYTGNSPVAKPANYGSRAVPLDVFRRVVEEGIREHNARLGRTSPIAAGRSFEQVFRESYAASPIRKATAEQRRLWLMSADAVTVRKPDGAIHLFGNRYWAEFLHGSLGQKVTARFDPDRLWEPLHVYALDGRYLGAAPAQEMAGFDNVEAAALQARRVKDFQRATRAQVAAEHLLSPAALAAAMPKVAAPPEMEPPRLVRPTFGNTALKPVPVREHEEESEAQLLMLRGFEAQSRAGGRPGLHLVEDQDDA